MLLAVHHVQLAIPAGGEDRARAFYGGLLGLVEVAKPSHLAGRGGCWFEGGAGPGGDAGLRLHLGVEDDFRPARKAHPALLVDGLAELVDRLRSAEVAVREDEALDGYERADVEDPFGNRIELLEPHVGGP